MASLPSVRVTPPPQGEAVSRAVVESPAPHGAEITIVAATEQGDAALTVDVRGGVRLWPTLDGTRMPVPLRIAGEANQIALVQAGGLPGSPDSSDLVAAIRDSAGAVTLLRLGRDGIQKSRVQLPGTSYVSIAATASGVLARTADHLVEWYALDGSARGALVADPGQRIVELAARHDRAAAVIAERDTLFVRWIALGDTARWEPAVKLDGTVKPGMFAVAPHARRIAFVDTAGHLHVDDVGLQLTSLVHEETNFGDAQSTIGFTDDDSVVAPGFVFQWWNNGKAPAGVQPTTRMLTSEAPTPAFTDTAAIASSNGQLVIASQTQAKYLGWSTLAVGGFYYGDGRVVLAQSSSVFSWIDEGLQRIASVDLRENRSDHAWAYGQPIGAHYLIVQRPYGEQSDIDVQDVAQPSREMRIVDDARVDQYFPADDMLGIRAGNKLRRFKLDLEAMTFAEQMPRVQFDDYSVSWARVFDPARANGIAAVVMSWEHESSASQTLTTWRVVGDKLIASRDRKIEGQVLRAWSDGTLALHDSSRDLLTYRRGDEILETVKTAGMRGPFAISEDRSRIARRDEHDIYLLDGKGNELWKSPMWGASNVMFSATGKHVLAAGAGGLVAFDAETGRQTARECGFEFGLHDKGTDIGPVGSATVCEDPLLQ